VRTAAPHDQAQALQLDHDLLAFRGVDDLQDLGDILERQSHASSAFERPTTAGRLGDH
jgi:hypothetical protein